MVVFGGFSGAIYLIQESFYQWKQSPITTTIGSSPIKDFPLPNITVCPPAQTFTDLNYDLIVAENQTLDNETRMELVNYGLELLQNHLFEEFMRNLSKLRDSNRFLNWYNGYTKIDESMPSFWYDQFWIGVKTSATEGSVRTEYFGEKFDKEKVEKDIFSYVHIYTNCYSGNETINIKAESYIMNHLTSEFEIDKFEEERARVDLQKVNKNLAILNQNITLKDYTGLYFQFQLERKLSTSSLRNTELPVMPGFEITWKFVNKDVKPINKYADEFYSKQFVKYVLPSITIVT